MTTISTHVLDTSQGRPAAGIGIRLEQRGAGDDWSPMATAVTDDDGRAKPQPSGAGLSAGVYRLTFDTKAYFARAGTRSFYPEVTIAFEIASGESHYHVPLLLSPWGYTTYRGS